MRRDSLCTVDCTSAVERYVWSGDQRLYEFRAPGGDNASASQLENDVASGREFGRIAYTHAAGIDAPPSVIRRGGPYGDVTLIPHSDYRGAYPAGSLPSGAGYTCMPAQPCLYVVWPKKYWGSYWDGGDPTDGDWAGSLIRGNQDVSGLMYRRNRYYDPATGQFTQSDPIGIAGGLNTYGFAAGDPISFTDPFGLCPDDLYNAETKTCPGGLSREQWAAVEEGLETVAEQEAKSVRSMMRKGRVHADELGLGRLAQTVWSHDGKSDQIDLNTTPGASFFELDAYDRGWVLGHERGHVLQNSGTQEDRDRLWAVTALQRLPGVAGMVGSAFQARLEDQADRHACRVAKPPTTYASRCR